MVARPGIKDPSVGPVWRAVQTLCAGGTVGALGAAAFSAHVSLRLLRAGRLPTDRTLIAGAVGAAAIGFGVGYGAMSTAQWARWRLIQLLLAYREWMYRPKAASTKVWGLMLKLLLGPGPHTMKAFQNVLPKLPIPPIKDTCERYLRVCKPLLTSAEYDDLRACVNELLDGDGDKLQTFLQNKRRQQRSWLADWWMDTYLHRRESIAINVNFFMSSTFLPEVSTNGLARTANTLHSCMAYYDMIKTGILPPDLIMGLIPVCMDGVNYMFSSCRIPGEVKDHLENYPNATHVVVISRGVYYRFEMYIRQPNGKLSSLTKREIKKQLQIIYDETKDIPLDEMNPVAVLTSQDRATWAKHRAQLQQDPVNARTLREIESSIVVQVLGHEAPKSISEQAHLSLTGDGTTRWFDKCLTMEVFNNGSAGGCNMEHTGADATHFAVMWEHVLQQERYGPDGDLVVVPGEVVRDLPPPQRLEWHLDAFSDVITRTLGEFRQTAASMDVVVIHTAVGRGWMKANRVSPDGFLQMAVQLAYWRLHKTWTKTYEPSSSRLFQLGRTDNMNPVSEASINWVLTMEDPRASRDAKLAALKAATAFLSSVRLDATAGRGCERHLLGLQMAANELGLPTPRLFNHKAWSLPMKLSTSQVPTDLGSYGLSLVPESIMGGFGPTDPEGYGLLYVPIADGMYNMVITSWRTCADTDSVVFGRTLEAAMADMRALVEGGGGETKPAPAARTTANM